MFSVKDKKSHKRAVGIVGIGFISQVYVEALRSRRDFELRAISDSDQALLLHKGKKLGVQTLYPDYRFMLKDPAIDVIIVATPNHLHKQIVCDALHSRKIVICEKPIATSLPEVDSMIQTSLKQHKHIYLKQYLRYSTAYQKAKDMMIKGKVGTPYYVQCTFTDGSIFSYLTDPDSWVFHKQKSGGGVWIDIGVHIMDLLYSFFGRPISVYGEFDKRASALEEKGEDVATAIVSFPENITANIYCTMVDRSHWFRWEIRIYGSKGQLAITDSGKDTKTLQYINADEVKYEFIENNWWSQSNLRAVHDIFDRIAQDAEPVVSLDEARSVLAALLGVYQSAKKSRKIALR